MAPDALLYLPGGQALQDVCPSWSWYVPCKHIWPSLYLPFAVAVHLSLAFKPVVAPILPAGHLLHPLADETPLAPLYLPIGQFKQVDELMALSVLLYFPAVHNMQLSRLLEL